MYFVRLLTECEGNICVLHCMFSFHCSAIESSDPDHLTLADILIFFSGVDSIPPLGFSCSPTLTFHNRELPSSSTCALTLTLPIHSDYVSFKAKVTFGMKHHGGFGKPQLNIVHLFRFISYYIYHFVILSFNHLCILNSTFLFFLSSVFGHFW